MNNEPYYLEIISTIDEAYKDYKKLNIVKGSQTILNLVFFVSIVCAVMFPISLLLLLSHIGTGYIVIPMFVIASLLAGIIYFVYLINGVTVSYQLGKKRGMGKHPIKNRVINDIEFLDFAKNRIDAKKITESKKIISL